MVEGALSASVPKDDFEPTRHPLEEFHFTHALVEDEDANIVRLRIGREQEKSDSLRIVGLSRAIDFLSIVEDDLQLPAVLSRLRFVMIVVFLIAGEFLHKEDGLHTLKRHLHALMLR